LTFSSLYHRKSQGNIWYPLILFSWWLARLLVPRKKVKIGDLNFTLSCTNWITHFRWYLFTTKEPETIYFLNNFLEEGDIFFDIGANVGVFSIYAGKRYQDIMIHSFEPEASNLAILKENIVQNRITEKVIINGFGISDSVGLSKLHLSDLTSGAGINTENPENIEKSAEGNHLILWSQGIYTISLDYYCNKLNIIPRAIKIDTDGSESKILMGALNVLKNPLLRAIIIEMPINHINHDKSILIESGFRKKEHGFKLPKGVVSGNENVIWIKK